MQFLLRILGYFAAKARKDAKNCNGIANAVDTCTMQTIAPAISFFYTLLLFPCHTIFSLLFGDSKVLSLGFPGNFHVYVGFGNTWLPFGLCPRKTEHWIDARKFSHLILIISVAFSIILGIDVRFKPILKREFILFRLDLIGKKLRVCSSNKSMIPWVLGTCFPTCSLVFANIFYRLSLSMGYEYGNRMWIKSSTNS